MSRRIRLGSSGLIAALATSNAIPQERSREMIVYSTLRPANQDIYLVDGPGEKAERVTTSPALDYNATFSPDGRWLVFTSDRNGNTDLYAVDLQRQGREVVRLTRNMAMDDAPDIAPDGESVTFVSTRDGDADIFVMPFAPGDPAAESLASNLTNRPGGDFNPKFSPDGSSIAWVRQGAVFADGELGELLSPDWYFERLKRSFATTISVMRANGSGARHVVGGDAMIAGAPAWSLDGQSIYFHGVAMPVWGPSFYGEPMVPRIFRVDVAGGEAEPLTAESSVALTPAVTAEGRVAFYRGPSPPDARPLYRRTGSVFTIGPEGSGPRPEVDSAGLEACLAPAYAREGRLACHGPGPAGDLPQMSHGHPFSAPGTLRTVEFPDRTVQLRAVQGYLPDFLPDARLVYGEWSNDLGDPGVPAEFGNPPLVTSRLDGTERRVLFGRKDLGAFMPATCANGRWIAFTVNSLFDQTVTSNIWKVRPDGTGAVNLTAASDMASSLPAWSPDCGRIYFRGVRNGASRIYSMDADGRDVRRLTERDDLELAPDVSPDGEWITFVTDRGGAGGLKIWIQRLDGGDGRFLEPARVRQAGVDMHPRFSSDGEWIVFVSDRGGLADEMLLLDDPQPFGDVWAIPIDGGQAVRLTNDRWEDGPPQWGQGTY